MLSLPAAYVLGLYDTGLGVARSLGRRGMPVRGFDSAPDLLGSFSRFCQHQACPDPVTNSGGLVDFLLDAAKREPAPPILFPTSDAFVLFLSRWSESARNDTTLRRQASRRRRPKLDSIPGSGRSLPVVWQLLALTPAGCGCQRQQSRDAAHE